VNKKETAVPQSNIARLPRYYRFLNELSKKGIQRISSKKLAEIMSVTASQIRQDFSVFGLSGQQGYGYSVEGLRKEISVLLGLETIKPAVLIGVGNLGRAIASLSFGDKGYRIIGAFDYVIPEEYSMIAGVKIQTPDTLEDFCREFNPECAFLCLPEERAPKAVEQLIGLNVRYFWNFSHYDIKKDYPDAIVENVHLGDSLMKLSYNIATTKNRGE